MKSSVFNGGHGPAAACQPLVRKPDIILARLEALPTGSRCVVRDGSRFIRTNLICLAFCNLSTGQLCSAREVCAMMAGPDPKRASAH